ncbi:hypothetical protein ACXZ1K_11305 [Pedobacter sp. PWIIR3]
MKQKTEIQDLLNLLCKDSSESNLNSDMTSIAAIFNSYQLVIEKLNQIDPTSFQNFFEQGLAELREHYSRIGEATNFSEKIEFFEDFRGYLDAALCDANDTLHSANA